MLGDLPCSQALVCRVSHAHQSLLLSDGRPRRAAKTKSELTHRRRRRRHDEQYLHQRRHPRLSDARPPVALPVPPRDAPGDRIDVHIQQPLRPGRARPVGLVVPYTDADRTRDTPHRRIAQAVIAPPRLQRAYSGPCPDHQAPPIVPLGQGEQDKPQCARAAHPDDTPAAPQRRCAHRTGHGHVLVTCACAWDAPDAQYARAYGDAGRQRRVAVWRVRRQGLLEGHLLF